MTSQLYKIFDGVGYPSLSVLYGNSRGKSGQTEHSQPYYAFSWPSGAPCIPIEMYLQEKARTLSTNILDGGTVKVYAANLSHLARFCEQHQIDFCNLVHADLEELSRSLSLERTKTGRPQRNNNTINRIVSTTVNFLSWLQTWFLPKRALIGVDTQEKKHQIKLIRKRYRVAGGRVITQEVFASAVPCHTTAPKPPMPSAVRERLWATLIESRASFVVSKKLQGYFSAQEQQDHLRYMYARRELQLILLEATGLRPQELILISCSDNLDRLIISQLSLPTLKGRDRSPRKRVIPIDRQVAMKIETFIFVHRKKLIERLKRTGLLKPCEKPSDLLYLNSETGKGVKPSAAYQEFRRLCVRAEIDQRSCQSMFRHRFITNMVKLHLVSFVENNPHKNRHMMTESDYRTILQKVATYTGHKSVDSLLHYIDLAWEELDAFSSIYDLKKMQDNMRSICFKINEIRANIQDLGKSSRHKIIEEFENQLSEIYQIAVAMPNSHTSELDE